MKNLHPACLVSLILFFHYQTSVGGEPSSDEEQDYDSPEEKQHPSNMRASISKESPKGSQDDLSVSPIEDEPGQGQIPYRHPDEDEDVTILEQRGPNLVRPNRIEEDDNDREFMEKGEVEGEEEERALAQHQKDVDQSDFEEIDIEKEEENAP